jgi:hypothetical protein
VSNESELFSTAIMMTDVSTTLTTLRPTWDMVVNHGFDENQDMNTSEIDIRAQSIKTHRQCGHAAKCNQHAFRHGVVTWNVDLGEIGASETCRARKEPTGWACD